MGGCVKAIVGDGATVAVDRRLHGGAGLDVTAPFSWTLITGARVLSGTSPGPLLEDLVPRAAPTPPLFISAGKSPGERKANLHYAEVAREPFELWHLRDVNHTAAIRERAAEYKERAVGFVDRALGR